MSVASLVIGIIFLAAVWITVPGLQLGLDLALEVPGSFHFAPLPAGIVGLILGILAVRKQSKSGIAIAGIVLNAIVILCLVAKITMLGIIGL